MDRKEILLSFIALPEGKPNVLSPIQIMKGMFLVKQELHLKNFYQFKPYLYGPCSLEVYRDVQRLVGENFILPLPSVRGWKFYMVSSKGSKKFEELSKKMDREFLESMRRIKRIVMEKSFIELLKYVYRKYPEFAVNSVINVEVIK